MASLGRKLFALSFLLSTLPALIAAQQGGETHQQDGGTDYFRREHSLVKPYTGGVESALPVLRNKALAVTMLFSVPGAGMDIPLWDFGGSTVVSNEYIRLTPDRQSKQGHLWNHVVGSDKVRSSVDYVLKMSVPLRLAC